MNDIARKQDQGLVVLRTISDLRAWRERLRAAGKTLAMVPTMGALHDGHLELVRQGFEKADAVLASIFVNPTQFAPHEDLDAYPRTWDADLEKLTALGTQAIFYPSVSEMYPDGFVTNVSVGGVSGPLEGAHRPGHFDGVATVVSKLLLMALPDAALFGEKDWQQLQVIKRMTADLNIPVEICGVPIVRDENGLALSSRNAYLSAEQYKIACALNKTLFAMAEKIRAGQDHETVQRWGVNEIEQAGFDKIDYLEIRDAASLSMPCDKALRILVAAKLGKARLIDNVAV
ncbi:MAG: pantoate--beta-alanine ligase [Rhodospirillales bacterium]|nr:pantoate--beta-alanine ligase [Rhodospirillales bacterium]MCB9997242.1 pantoate--beta-alanine ligase [Rhodospirillales bacterium]